MTSKPATTRWPILMVSALVLGTSACGGGERSSNATPGSESVTAAPTVALATGQVDATSKATPAPMGATVPVGSGWTFAITSFDSNANDEIAEHAKSNDPPNGDRQYVIVGLTASYDGEAPTASLVFGPRLKAIGASGAEFEADRCGALVPNALKTAQQTTPGTTLEGNVCLLVKPAEATSLMFFSEDLVDDVTQHFEVR